MILTICICFAALLFLGVPIAVILGVTTLVSLVFFSSTPLTIITQQLFNALDQFVLLAIPFFILAGAVMTRGGIARRLINFVNVLVGWFPGAGHGRDPGLHLFCRHLRIIAGNGGCHRIDHDPGPGEGGYGEKFSLGLITVSGSLGIVIPPSIPMILYCLVMNVSVAKIFMAGVMPGLLIGFSLMVYTFLWPKNMTGASNRAPPCPG